MSELYLLCGLPGSGKSTYAEMLEKEKNCIIHSSDKIREELGDVNDQSKNDEVFKILHKRIKEELQNGKSVCYDACNLSRRRRVAFIRELKNIPCEKICVLVATPFEECLKQNTKRIRHVPDEVMWRMYKSFTMPTPCEGFDKVIVYYQKYEWKEYYGDIVDYVNNLRDFDQENSHHTLTLGDHMFTTMDNVLHMNRRCYDDVALAALSHDIGKIRTKSFLNSKGEIDIEAHYYNHHHYGAYDSLFLNYPNYVNKEYVALLIEFHMKPYMSWKQSEKAKEKDRRLFGDDIIADIDLLHEADINAK